MPRHARSCVPTDVLKRRDADGTTTILVDGVPLDQLQEFEKAVRL